MGAQVKFDIALPHAEDAEGMFAVYDSRLLAALPSFPEWSSAYRATLQQDDLGIAKFKDVITSANRDSGSHFSRAAKIGNTVIGIASASALPDAEFTWLGALSVMQEYQDAGVGQALCEAGLPWAHGIDRPVRAYVDPGNKRCVDLLVNHWGFEKVDEAVRGKWLADAMPNINPIVLDVMELSTSALASFVDPTITSNPQ